MSSRLLELEPGAESDLLRRLITLQCHRVADLAEVRVQRAEARILVIEVVSDYALQIAKVEDVRQQHHAPDAASERVVRVKIDGCFHRRTLLEAVHRLESGA